MDTSPVPPAPASPSDLPGGAPLHIEYPPQLPISARAADIRAALREHQVLIVAGATGSGKTTQLPKLALEVYNELKAAAPPREPGHPDLEARQSDGAGGDLPATGTVPQKKPRRAPLIGVTQPRRIAATSVAARVAEELKCPLGRDVGYQIRFENRTSPETALKFMTDGILLSEIQGDPLLRRYHTLIIDEAHERGLTIDFLLGWLKRILARRRDLKVIISSATIETARFSEFFDGAPVIEVEGRTFPVDVLYEPPDPDLDLPDVVAQTVENLAALDPHGDFLVFLPGEREITETERALTHRKLRHTEILPLFARLSAAEQNKVFSTRSLRRVLLATNVAETSLTIPGIVYVVDAGVARLSRYDSRTGITRLHVEQISQASADQRKGRAGRVREGICVRLYDESNFVTRQPFTDPEILRVGLDGVILRMKSLGLGDVEDFPFIDPPPSSSINEGYRVLGELGALDDERRLTPLGKQLARFPVDPRVARMILQGASYGVLPDVLVLAAALEVQDVRERPRDQESKADQAHRRFRDETSDFVGLLKLWAFIDEAGRQSSGNLRRVCKDNYLSQRRVREWREVHRQLESTVKELRLNDGGERGGNGRGGNDRNANRRDVDNHRGSGNDRSRRNPSSAAGDGQDVGLDHTAKVHCALLSGLLSRIGQYNAEKRVYFGARQTRFVIHPSSSLAKKPPAWVMAFELVETSQLFARASAKVEPEWFALVADHLLKRSYSDPHWSEKTARAVVKEHATLFGLQVLKDRSIDYATVAPGRARLIFLDHALVRGEYASPGAFQHANRKLLTEVAELRNKARKSDMLSDEEALLSFFDTRVPAQVVNGKTFETWREQDEKQSPRRLFLSMGDVLLADEQLSPEDYPNELALGGTKLPLSYAFEPTADNDGITVSIPLAVLPRLDPALFDWTIPAWHEIKLVELLLRLPKATQRKLGNLNALAHKLASHLVPFSDPFVPALERAIRLETSTQLTAGELRPDLLPGYLRFTFRIIGDEGKVLAESRDADGLFRQFGASARSALAEVTSAQWRRRDIRAWDFGDLPASVSERVLGSFVELYPALFDRETSVELDLVSSPELAQAESRRGLLRLAILTSERALTQLDKTIPKLVEPLTATVSPIGHSSAKREHFRRQLVERALMEALPTQAPAPRTKSAFETWTKAGIPLLERSLGAVVQAVNGVNGELRETREALSRAAKQPSGAAALRDMTQQLEQLFPDDLLLRVSLGQLAHFPRYLKGMRVRLGRALTDPRKDADKAAPLAPLWQQFLKQAPTMSHERANQVRWLFEELRISTFAPELKPAFPVSVAKLKMILE